ncbi:hypothetical protein HanRHA438_Chr08g0352611 [Helianthus annuus]|uniref:Uncharacterized protein n=1 Tax=Helianthus annuus TaxID=4232 RepID=A0A9K3NDH6_HELAN|nr:hypothetical protein HanXRQr2_Chr08g0341171 [Helianthus annuus]KAJ0898061.1 hypothetical protein HanRHA438_Chr08g0352611 [Helianthus annuus]KAJ0901806.1 hypothetical protein HanPSC8_Chr08g0329601 [Helianthus annuus]
MVTPSSPNKSQDINGSPQSQNLLKNPSTELCRFTDPEIDRLYTCFTQGTTFRSFDSSTKSDSISPIWVCFPTIPFQIGYTYPFPDLTQRFFTLTGMCYSQAMPMLWRVLYTIEQIISDEGLDFNISELSHLYSLVSHGSHWFLFKAKPPQPLPILKTTKNDTSWKNQFFFMRRDSIPSGDSLPKKVDFKG